MNWLIYALATLGAYRIASVLYRDLKYNSKQRGLAMCGGFPSSTTRGKPLPKMTLWEAIVILWRETVSRPDRTPQESGHE